MFIRTPAGNKGVLDDVAYPRGVLRARPTVYNLTQFTRHVGNKVVEWPIAAVVYPVLGFLGWHLATASAIIPYDSRWA